MGSYIGAGIDYEVLLGEGQRADSIPWVKIGYNPVVTNVEEDVWSAGGLYTWPTGATAMEIVSSSAGDEDLGTLIHSGTADAGGSTTSIVKALENFSTTTAVGDLVILDKAGAVPEWGYVTAIPSNTVITVGAGFSLKGTGASRDYEVIDVSAKTGVHAVRIVYLNTAYEEKSEIVVLDGNAAVDLIGAPFRINSMRAISVGTAGGAVGALTLQDNGAGTVRNYMTARYTRARNQCYTVPKDRVLYVTQWIVGWSSPNETKVQAGRFYTKANFMPDTNFKTNAFYAFTEVILGNATVVVKFDIPTRIPGTTDIKVSGITTVAAATGPVTSALRGYLVR